MLGDGKQKETSAQAAAIEQADGFAQVFPEHKFRIIDVLQRHGHIVGMTGDGVNDAPALKEADCGIAVSGATDAARAAASIVLTTPGLSVIIEAIKESRRIFQRMNSYAIYRITETLRVLMFMTLAILVFNFYPVTAVMIVMLALLNDGAILSIAYDNVQYSDRPEAWDMRSVLGISTVLGTTGVLAAFGLFYLGERVFHLDRAHVQTLMYLKLSVAGHLTIFQTRTRGPWWSTRPAWILLAAVGGTQAVATLIAVYGVWLVPPLGWKYAAIVWVYALAWFLVTDPIKLLAYRVLDHFKAETKMKPKVVAKGDARADASKPAPKAGAPQANAISHSEPVSTAAPKPDASTPEPKAGNPMSDANGSAQPEAKATHKPHAEAKPKAGKSDSSSMLDQTLGEILLAGLAKDPEDAGRVIAAGLTQADGSAAAAPSHETKDKSALGAEADPKPDAA